MTKRKKTTVAATDPPIIGELIQRIANEKRASWDSAQRDPVWGLIVEGLMASYLTAMFLTGMEYAGSEKVAARERYDGLDAVRGFV